MKTTKACTLCSGGTPTPEQLEKINRQSRAALTVEQVYCFSVRLCDDRPDRDNERFDTDALPRLAELFIGKTGICDHSWSAKDQVARIFDARTEPEGEATILRAWAYMLRGEHTDPIIANIEAGIHREVSVGCAMAKTRCSVCGADYGSCEHRKGEVYGGQTCCCVLSEPVDAYEFSFVAVPAQPAAGVMKGFREDGSIQKNAELARRYMASLRAEGVRLTLALGLDVDKSILETMAGALNEDQTRALNGALRTIWDRKFACVTQLPAPKEAAFGFGTEYMI
ncbi:MAG: hypothetical protein E7424_04410 [Ruminococcaceae bacterium]|nr:hypothetical protein [Oscillospiraceae bacterium]